MSKHIFFLVLYFIVLGWSAYNPHDYFTWLLEIAPALLGAIILISSYSNFKFTGMTYFLILIHCIILFVGAHYTYAKVPLFDYIKEFFPGDRNHFDKLGHFAQGFVPAAITRELLIRKEVMAKKGWLNFLTVCVCMTVSALYELLEWGIAELVGQDAEQFLGTQGYQWDTQSDMLWALIGAISFLLTLSHLQNKVIDPVLDKKRFIF